MFCSIILGPGYQCLWASIRLRIYLPAGSPCDANAEIHLLGRHGFLKGVHQAAEVVRNVAGGKGPILALAVELAVESGLPLLPGYEMSEFSYFRHVQKQTAQLKVVNFERLKP